MMVIMIVIAVPIVWIPVAAIYTVMNGTCAGGTAACQNQDTGEYQK